jgi:hypothetical protein
MLSVFVGVTLEGAGPARGAVGCVAQSGGVAVGVPGSEATAVVQKMIAANRPDRTVFMMEP